MSRFSKSFSIMHNDGEDFVANRLVADLVISESGGRGDQVGLMRRKMMIGQMIDEIAKGLGDSLLNLDDSGMFTQMDQTQKAELLIEMVSHELSKQKLLDAVMGKAKSAQPAPVQEPAPVATVVVAEPEPEVEPESVKSRPVEIVEYREPDPEPEEHSAGPVIMEPANIFA